ncbi:LacI family transcriptional regulator [Salana multivorans]|uniref:LacI family transcriptional regulator n=1 Tax=Salana multivorans TaxID=120377 RepID=A0A3N2DBK7_9MICO|nr:LacI family DNA-binding transcriptional regulator [Salana multivorans]MBN8883614.1 LacI family DNA-binding transcriptional regulator [Salana multivorans]OJX95981.1 MAG: hypothetical protein BGO96_06660 [Micrococcales bacterium 73-15]ROR97185.1 LacI family transcriptional regulator [Salana multivorans]
MRSDPPTSSSRGLVTMRDVAAVAGVSISTVSKTLNGTGRVSAEARRRIVAAAERLEYRPNLLAQNFALGKSFTVGILTTKAAGLFAVPVITGVVSALGRHDTAVIVYDDGGDPRLRPRNVRKLQARRVDGIVVVGDGTDVSCASVTPAFSVPVVYALALSDDPGDSMLLPDDRLAGILAAQHLLGLGRRRVAHVTGAVSSRAVAERLGGLREGLGAGGADLVGPVRYGDWSRSWGETAGHTLDPSAIDAVFCGNDFIAIGVAGALMSRGIRVPEDVAIVGYDHWSKVAEQDRFLTSVDPLLSELGERAGELLLAAGGGGVELRPVQLVPGYSTGTPAGPSVPYVAL